MVSTTCNIANNSIVFQKGKASLRSRGTATIEVLEIWADIANKNKTIKKYENVPSDVQLYNRTLKDNEHCSLSHGNVKTSLVLLYPSVLDSGDCQVLLM